jgi:hypothetical protein
MQEAQAFPSILCFLAGGDYRTTNKPPAIQLTRGAISMAEQIDKCDSM